MSVTENRVKELINEFVYRTKQDTIKNFSNFTLSEQVNYALNLSLNKVTIDLEKAWYDSPELITLLSKKQLLKQEVLKYQDNKRNYYTVVKINNKYYVTKYVLEDFLQFMEYSVEDILSTESSKIIPSTTSDTSTSYGYSRDPSGSEFDSNGLLTKLPRQAFCNFVYWKNYLTGTESVAFDSLDSTPSDPRDTTSGTYPYFNEWSDNLCVNKTGDTVDYNQEKKYDNLFNTSDGSPSGIFNRLKDLYEQNQVRIISKNIIDNAIDSNGGTLNQTNGLDEILVQQIDKNIGLNLCVPTIPTFRVENLVIDNIAFYNPLLEYSLTEKYGYNSGTFGGGYELIKSYISDDPTYSKYISPNYGSSEGGAMIFSGESGFLLFYGIYNITNGIGVSCKYPPYVSAFKYIGETFEDGVISVGSSLPALVNSAQNDLFIRNTDNSIYRFEIPDVEGATSLSGEWIQLTGGSSITFVEDISGLDDLTPSQDDLVVIKSNNTIARYGGSNWITIGGGGGSGGGSSVWTKPVSSNDIYYNSGNVGIGLTDPSYALDVSGTIRSNRDMLTVATLTNSDIRHKKNIKTIENALEIVKQIRGVKYDNILYNPSQKTYGYIAQEMKKIIPEIVYRRPDNGYLAINYPVIIAFATESIKELNHKVDGMNSTIEDLNTKVDELTRQIKLLTDK